ncbi:glycosyltransferase family 8 protein [Clostridium sp. WLY-B-L2]|uniref:Glycosyltransferase family 8 protein n=1 Tax=Clostridium aromativorans TaxID=2836848 RepID=A0ABS8N0V4_9CLOT|nr:glycosyltransferase family 8 protein [Clostridium aromativorans]MCC9293423.1 glycosyltransferase family 8 protein [Clostridium aromativorans]
MNILVTLDSNYLKPLKVMLKSLFMNNPEERFYIYMMYSNMEEDEIYNVNKFVKKENHKLFIIKVENEHFKDSPLTMYYTKEMYYRLLAFEFLPLNVDKILYLDPDILVINPIRKLYDICISKYLYAAACHNILTVKEINKLRLKPYQIETYYNSGVLLMNIDLQREIVKEKEIYDFVKKNKNKLILPDQDIINALYSKYIKKFDEILFNYDPRYYKYNKILSKGNIDMDYVINNTSIIHFCGKKKPWQKNYVGEFYSLYKHYEKMALSHT